MTPSDAELVLACRAGDREAWAALVDRHGPRVLAALREYLRGSAARDIEDAVQELWVRLMEDSGRRLSSYDPSRPFAPWITVVAIHHARRRLSRARPGRPLESAPETQAPPVRPPLEEAEARAEVRSALDGLSSRDRLILELAEVEGVPHARIAGIIGVKAESVAPLVARARERLKGSFLSRNPETRDRFQDRGA